MAVGVGEAVGVGVIVGVGRLVVVGVGWSVEPGRVMTGAGVGQMGRGGVAGSQGRCRFLVRGGQDGSQGIVPLAATGHQEQKKQKTEKLFHKVWATDGERVSCLWLTVIIV